MMNFFTLYVLGIHTINTIQTLDERFSASVESRYPVLYGPHTLNASSNSMEMFNKTKPIVMDPQHTNIFYFEPNLKKVKTKSLHYKLSLVLNERVRWEVDREKENYVEKTESVKEILITKQQLKIQGKTNAGVYENLQNIGVNKTNYTSIMNNMDGLQSIDNKYIDYFTVNTPQDVVVENPTHPGLRSSLKVNIKTCLGNTTCETAEKVLLSRYVEKYSENSTYGEESKNVSSITSIDNKQVKLSYGKTEQLTTIHSYPYNISSRLLIRRPLPRKLLKRSVVSASPKELEIPTINRFPYATAGSSLYGSYASAHSGPAGFPPLGGEVSEPIEQEEGEGEVVRPIVGGGEVVKPIEGEEGRG